MYVSFDCCQNYNPGQKVIEIFLSFFSFSFILTFSPPEGPYGPAVFIAKLQIVQGESF